jgi:hypothetical protein
MNKQLDVDGSLAVPVLVKARAKKVATTMSQMTSLVIAFNPCWNVSVRVATVKVSAVK